MSKLSVLFQTFLKSSSAYQSKIISLVLAMCFVVAALIDRDAPLTWCLLGAHGVAWGLYGYHQYCGTDDIDQMAWVKVRTLVVLYLVTGSLIYEFLLDGNWHPADVGVFFVLYGILLSYVFAKTEPSVLKESTDFLNHKDAFHDVLEVTEKNQGVYICDLYRRDEAVPIYTSIEDRAVVIGPPGTGKTTFMITQLLEWIKQGHSFVCIDIKPEIHDIVRAKLDEYGYNTYIFDPIENVGHCYNPLDDIESVNGIAELAESLIPSSEGDSDGEVFSASARDLLDAIITYLRHKHGSANLPMVYEFVSEKDSYKDLLHELKTSDNQLVMDIANSIKMTSSNDRMLGAIFANFNTSLRFLRYPSIKHSLSKSDFSLSELRKGHTALFLTFRESSKDTIKKPASMLVGHIMRYLISHVDDGRPVLNLFDEIGNIAPIAGFKQKLNTIRSRHMPTWMYWQSKEQMQGYGVKPDEGPNIILGACDLQMVFRLNDNSTANYFSEKIGEVDRRVYKTSLSESDWNTGTTSSHDLVTEPKIKPHELQQLNDSEVVCMYKGVSWKAVATPYYQRYPEYDRAGKI